MKKKLLILFLFIATLNINAQTNLVPNGDMENWDSFDTNPDDWTRFFDGLWEKSADFQNGTASLQLEIASSRTFNYINTDNMSFTSGVTYVCTFYYKAVSGNLTQVEFNLSHTPGAFPTTFLTNSYTDSSTTEWKKGEFEYTATDTENVQAFIYSRGDAGAQVLIDNVSIFDKSTLSTNQLENNSNTITAYPNPSTDFIEISGFKVKENYTIYNILGESVLNGSIQEKEQIDLRNLTNGIYILKTENAKALKIIKE